MTRPHPVTIRRAESGDVPTILAIEAEALTAAHWLPEQYEKLVNSDHGVVLVAEQAGRLCGFACAKAVAGEWELENIAVSTEFRRRKIAEELMRALIQCAQHQAASAILLEVRESNLSARRLYEKHGFREVGRRSRYYLGPAENALLYKLQLQCGGENTK